jgi:hypothetical protein
MGRKKEERDIFFYSCLYFGKTNPAMGSVRGNYRLLAGIFIPYQ